MTPTGQDFLEKLRVRVRSWGGAEWIADRVDGGHVVVLYRQHLLDRDEPAGLVEGARMNVEDFTAEAAGPDIDAEPDVEAVLEIVEPHPIGVPLKVPWADGLTACPHDVRWYGAALDYADRL